MATSNKVFVSPGVYTSERDLSFVAQSVGVTTLGLVGEALKGPAFEPIFITSFDEYETYFGGTSTEKFVNTQIPKYEMAYIAKSYLQQSNQLFVTRILGLSGYDAGPSWTIKTIANPNTTTIGLTGSTPVGFTVTFSANSTGTVNILTNGLSAYTDVNTSYTKIDGSTSTFTTDLQNFLLTVFGNDTAAVVQVNSASTSYIFGSLPAATNTTYTSGSYTASTNVLGVYNTNASSQDYTSYLNDPWYYSLFNISTGNNYFGRSFVTFLSSLSGGLSAGSYTSYTGTISGQTFGWSGTAYSAYNNMVVATLRSRGVSNYGSGVAGPDYVVSAASNVNLIDINTGVTKNPYTEFRITGLTTTSSPTSFSITASMQQTGANYLSKVLSKDNFAIDRTVIPLFVEEIYPNLLNFGYNKGYIRGLSTSLIQLPGLRAASTTGTMAYFLDPYQTPRSPWVVSELRGNKVYELFKVITISDGNAANTQVKISILNMSFNNLTFDIAVRDFYDTDTNPVILEKFTNCTMDPSQNSYVGVKVGTSDGEYQLNSKFIMLELNYDAPVDAIPCGFEGLVERTYSSTSNVPPQPVYKTKYDFPGEVIYNPPFGNATGSADNSTTSSGDKVRTTYLGFSSQLGIDSDLFQYKGKQNPTSICNEASDWTYQTKGYHMDSGATVVTIANSYLSSGTSAFEVGSVSFTTDPTDPTNPYYKIQSRKFTFLVQGGFDGWDIYRERRTNGDEFILGGSGYKKGVSPTCDTRYPSATGWGAFRPYTYGNNITDYATTDYYAYLLGIQTFANPEATNINVFATPGIDYVNNSNLVEDAIEMVEQERADSIYITTTPDIDLLVSTVDTQDFIDPTEAVNTLDDTGIDSNYTATYYPWILVRDTVNNTQIYLPSTGEVCRNLALTDNIAFPWFASAGYTRGLVSSVKARRKLTQTDRDTLYQGRINPIATFSDVGTVIWGNKTLQVAQSALDRLNVRRLLLQARKLISAVAVRLLFEQNDEKVRQDFLDAVNPILDSIRRDRGLYDFRVTVSSSPEDLDRNQLVGKVYIKPTKSLEFIDIEFLITPTGASFENI